MALWLPNGLYPAVAVDMLCWALFAVAIDLLLGYGGLLSFGHAAFWGTSAYTDRADRGRTSACRSRSRSSAGRSPRPPLAVPIGYLAVKRTGIYFAMVTLAFAQLVYFVANEWRR